MSVLFDVFQDAKQHLCKNYSPYVLDYHQHTEHFNDIIQQENSLHL